MLKESIGERIRTARIRSNMTQAQLAEKLGLSTRTIVRIENGESCIDVERIHEVASLLNTRPSYLLGETDDPDVSYTASAGPNWGAMTNPPVAHRPPSESDAADAAAADPAGWKWLPMYNKMAATCGRVYGGSAYAEPKIKSWHYFPAAVYGTWDPERPPYMYRFEGDGMKEAYIHDGSVIIVNPAEEVFDGESALVCWDNAEVAVKLIYWQKDGGIELHAANSAHRKIYTYSKEDIEDGRLVIKGKVMWAGQRPRRMR